MIRSARAATFCLGVLGTLAVPSGLRAGTSVSVPIDCTRGPSGQVMRAIVTMPAQVEAGGRITVRVDGVSSGTISHTGLRFIHDMTTEFAIPAGATYVPGSLRVVPNTGTPNVAATARVAKIGNVIRLSLPGEVQDGSSYTPPSFELALDATGTVGSKVGLQFTEYRVVAKAVIIGDVETTCTPKPKPYTLASATVVAKP